MFVTTLHVLVTLFFLANDIIIFCQASVYANENIQCILSAYVAASGQQISKAKIGLLFSRNTGVEEVAAIKANWGVQTIQQHAKYPRLPSFVD